MHVADFADKNEDRRVKRINQCANQGARSRTRQMTTPVVHREPRQGEEEGVADAKAVDEPPMFDERKQQV